MENKVALITGGSRGIGADLVKTFSENGYSVAFTYKNSKEKAKEISCKYNAVAIRADSAKENEALSAVNAVIDKFGKIDVLINNAGMSSFSLFTDITAEQWREIFDVNVHGAFYFTREVSRKMIEKKQGRIINISSMWGISGSSCEVHYSATKAALIGMTKALAKELGPSGINVNCIAPGVINTEMNATLSKEDIEALAYDTPLGRIGEPSDVSKTALFLAEESSSFVTGQIISVDGGYII